ncbi:MAG: hypothetical protein QG567_2374 [Campylobacterota bacterium]|nr:hypothetical protein [Campylobacterota bacterium]
MSKIKKGFEGLEKLSLGFSIVIAVLIGVGIGIVLKNLTGIGWLLWLGVAWGVGAAIMNVYKAYQKLKKEMDEYAEEKNARNPKYKNSNNE